MDPESKKRLIDVLATTIFPMVLISVLNRIEIQSLERKLEERTKQIQVLESDIQGLSLSADPSVQNSDRRLYKQIEQWYKERSLNIHYGI